MRILLLVTVLALGPAGLTTQAAQKGAAPIALARSSGKASALHPPTAAQINAARKQGKVKARLETSKGPIQLELDGAAAPIAVANFLNLVKAGFYRGLPFHRVEPGFVIQAGDPAQVNRPPVGYTIQDERSPIKHLRGTIAMARIYQGGQMIPNSASTQFYITLADTPHLDQLGFTAFGKVIDGMAVVDKIAVGDKILKAAVVGKPSKPVK